MVQCESLSEIRSQIDRLDESIAGLLGERAALVHQVARFKDSEAAVIVPERIEEIIARVRGFAARDGADQDLLEAIYRSMINIFIAFEQNVWRRLPR